MKAVVQTRYGSVDDLEVRDVAVPEPAAGELLVRVHAASLHPDVWHVVVGRPWVLRLMGGGFRRPKNPIPGTDMAGIVESVGKGVTRFRPGDAVFGETYESVQWSNGGAFAEYVSVREEWLARKPGSVSFVEAASVPSAGYIALFNFRILDEVGPRTRVLVNGAGGGVGSISLQLARARGAHVTAVDSAAKLDMLRSLGADEVVDYRAEDFTRRGERYDVIVDIPGNRPFSEIRPVLEPEGRYIPIGHEHYGAAGHRIFGLIPHFLRLMGRARFSEHLGVGDVPAPTRREAMEALASHIEAGTLTPVVDGAYPLEEVHEAFRHMIEDEPRGRVMLTPRSHSNSEHAT